MRRWTALLLAVLGWTTVAQAASAATITGDGFANKLFGTTAADTISGLGDGDDMFGRRGKDSVWGGVGTDAIFGARGNDRLYGDEDADTVVDDAGGGQKPDRLYGGSGDDAIFAADGKRDVIDCGADDDAVYADARDTLTGCESIADDNEDHPNIKFGTNTNESMSGATMQFGKGGNDTLNGSDAAHNALFGGPGADNLIALNGNDRLYDDDGTPGDQLLGGPGDDWLYSADGAADTVSCGDGTFDYAWVDEVDDVTECEGVYEG